jgi:hypothetical protein
MAAPPIPPIPLGLIGTGLAVGQPHCPASRGLADRSQASAFTDSSAAPSNFEIDPVLTGGAIGNHTAILLGAPHDAQQLRRHHSHDSPPRYRRRLPRGARRAARTTHRQFGVFRRMNDPQRGARLAVPAVATSPRR